jgi:hypothetical protein
VLMLPTRAELLATHCARSCSMLCVTDQEPKEPKQDACHQCMPPRAPPYRCSLSTVAAFLIAQLTATTSRGVMIRLTAAICSHAASTCQPAAMAFQLEPNNMLNPNTIITCTVVQNNQHSRTMHYVVYQPSAAHCLPEQPTAAPTTPPAPAPKALT